eukprot:TRINITY_DN5336_c0_g1_i9.p1 TRINITY_DN5336_c0_g1~~TRINITY_DN5336_c0_g1_i9.p1  ORF type:complete len:197 (+),score=29.08 TRINITY_DN5336_c0_g1_i9:478-1068(+)
MDENKLLQALQLQSDQVLNIYVYGSRLWRTAAADSDWDFLIVTRGAASKSTCHSGSLIDAVVMGEDEYTQHLQQHRFLPLITMYLPSEAVWRQRLKPQDVVGRRVNHDKLRAAVLEESDRDMKFAEKLFRKSNVAKGKKVLSHCVRMVALTRQILQRGTIENWTAANNLTQEIQSNPATDWSVFLESYAQHCQLDE